MEVMQSVTVRQLVNVDLSPRVYEELVIFAVVSAVVDSIMVTAFSKKSQPHLVS